MTVASRAKRTLWKKTSFAGPYFSCTARAIAKPSAEERTLLHGITSIHSALDIAAVLAGAESEMDCSASVLGEPVVSALCGIVDSARAWRESMWAALIDLVRVSIIFGEVELLVDQNLVTAPARRPPRPRSHDVKS